MEKSQWNHQISQYLKNYQTTYAMIELTTTWQIFCNSAKPHDNTPWIHSEPHPNLAREREILQISHQKMEKGME